MRNPFKILWRKLLPTKHILISSKTMQIACDMKSETLESILFLDGERIETIYKNVESEGFNLSDTPPHHLLYVFSKYCNHPNELVYFSFIVGLYTTNVEIINKK